MEECAVRVGQYDKERSDNVINYGALAFFDLRSSFFRTDSTRLQIIMSQLNVQRNDNPSVRTDARCDRVTAGGLG